MQLTIDASFLLFGVLACGAAVAQADEGLATPTLRGTPTMISAENRAQTLRIDFGPRQARSPYVVLGTASGTFPGLRAGGLIVPLNPDSYFWLTAHGAHRLSNDRTGLLGVRGDATVLIRMSPPLTRLFASQTLHHAILVLGQRGVVASNAVPMRIAGRAGPGPMCDYSVLISGPMQHAAGTNRCGWLDRNGASVFRNTRVTLAWLTVHFGGKCFVDPNVAYESTFAIHLGTKRKDPPVYAHFFPNALDKNGDVVKYRVRILGAVVQGSYPPAPSTTATLEFSRFSVTKDTGKRKAACEQRAAVVFPDSGKVVVTLTR